MSSEDSPVRSPDEELFSRTLSRLSAHGSDSAASTPEGTPLGSAIDVSAPSFLTWRCVSAARNLSLSRNSDKDSNMNLWQGASISAVAKSLKSLMESNPSVEAEDETSFNVKKRLTAAAFYSNLLMMPNSPVSGLFDVATLTTFLSTLRRATWVWPSSATAPKERNQAKKAPKGKSKASKALLDAMDLDSDDEGGIKVQHNEIDCDDALSVCTCCLLNLSSFLSNSSSGFNISQLGDQVLSLVVDALVDLTSCLSKTSSSSKGPSEAAYTALSSLLSSSSIDSNALAVISHRLAPTLMGHFTPSLTPSAAIAKAHQGAAADKARRQAAIHFLAHAAKSTDGSTLLPALQSLSRFILMRSADKAEQRAASCSSYSDIISLLLSSSHNKEEVGQQVGTFLVRLSQSTKVNHRVMAVEASHLTLSSLIDHISFLLPLMDPQQPKDDLIKAPLAISCLSVLIKRSSDKVSTVRAKAISHLADYVDNSVKGRSSDVFSFAISAASQLSVKQKDEPKGQQGQKKHKSKKAAAADDEEHEDEEGAPSKTVPSAPSEAVAILPGHLMVDLTQAMDMARMRCKDEKGMVRKAAVQLLESLILNNSQSSFNPADFEPLEAATYDPLVSIRRSSLSSIVRLVNAFPSNTLILDLFIKSCLPLIHDTEASVQEDVLKAATDLLFTPLSSKSVDNELVKPLMTSLASLGPQLAAHSLNKLTGLLLSKKMMDGSKVSRGIESLLALPRSKGDSWPLGALMLLEQVASHEPRAPSWQFLRAQWQALSLTQTQSSRMDGREGEEGGRLLWVISHSSSLFPPPEAEALAQELLKSVLSFNLPPTVAAAHISALSRLALSSTKSGQASNWNEEVMAGALELLVAFMDNKDQSAGDEMRAGVALFTAGEVVMSLKQSISTGALRGPININKGLLVRVQALTSPSSSPSSSSHWVGAHAWTCLGKFCLTEESLAKKWVPLFVQELSRSPSPTTRNNILVSLSDMISHFTSLGDMHLPRLASCVSDPNPLVRVQSLALLAHLLLKDFIKWRGELFHQFTLSLVDDSSQVRKLGEYLLGDALTSKAPLLAYNHFVECMFVLNRCKGQINANQSQVAVSIDEASKGKVDLSGSSEQSRAKRDHIYKTLLKRMAPEHKFSTQAKIVSEIFGGIADGALVLEECSEVLYDALRLLPSPEIKVNAAKLASGADEEAMETKAPSQSNEVAANARGKLVGALVRRHLVEGVLPLLVELRHMMQASRHPLLGPLMSCMAQLLRDHKTEIEDILAGDRQLAKELAFDMRQAEAASKAHRSAQGHSAALAPPAAPPPAAAQSLNAPPKTPRGMLQDATDARPMSTAGRSVLSSVLKKRAENNHEVGRENSHEVEEEEEEEDQASVAIAALTPAPVSSRRGNRHVSLTVGAEDKADEEEVVVNLPLNHNALDMTPSALKPWHVNHQSLDDAKEKQKGKERAKAKVKAVRELTRASIGSLLGDENEPYHQDQDMIEEEPVKVKVEKRARARGGAQRRNAA